MARVSTDTKTHDKFSPHLFSTDPCLKYLHTFILCVHDRASDMKTVRMRQSVTFDLLSPPQVKPPLNQTRPCWSRRLAGSGWGASSPSWRTRCRPPSAPPSSLSSRSSCQAVPTSASSSMSVAAAASRCRWRRAWTRTPTRWWSRCSRVGGPDA